MPAAFTPLRLRALRSGVAVLGMVLALHLWLLGGLPHLFRPGESRAHGEIVAPLRTRMIALPQAQRPPTALPTSLETASPAPLPVASPPPSPAPSKPAGESAEAHPPPTPTAPLPDQASVQPVAAPETAPLPATDRLPSSGPAQAQAQAQAPTSASASASAVSDVPANPPVPLVPEPAAKAQPLPRVAFPPPVVLNYDVFGQTDGQKNAVSATITWKQDGENYQASLVITKFLFPLRQWTSKGRLTPAGLAPLRFGEKGLRRAEVASHFVRDEGRVVFSANSAPVPLLPGAQDHLSVFMQLASLWAGEPNRLTAGDTVSFQSIGPRQAETWTFVVSPEERITVPGGSMQAIKLTREATGDYSTKAEIWLAPQLGYLPAHIRLSEPNGNLLDMVWTDSQLPP